MHIDATVRQLTDEMSKMSNDMSRLRDEMMSMWKVLKDKKVWYLFSNLMQSVIQMRLTHAQPLPVPDFEKTKPTNTKYPNPWSPHNLRAMSPYESSQEGWPQSPLEASNSMRRIMHDGATFDDVRENTLDHSQQVHFFSNFFNHRYNEVSSLLLSMMVEPSKFTVVGLQTTQK